MSGGLAITFDTVKTTGGPDVLDWTYNPTNADLDFLEPGDKLTLTFNALVSDGHATTESQPLTVTLLAGSAPPFWLGLILVLLFAIRARTLARAQCRATSTTTMTVIVSARVPAGTAARPLT